MSALINILLQIATSSCVPLYDPEIPVFPLTSSNLTYSASPYPIDFISSGDECDGPIPVWKISFLNQYEESTILELIKKMSPELQVFSHDEGFEICARICETEQKTFIAQPVTIGSHISCVASPKTCPSGGIPTKETVHTHGSHSVFVVNKVDAIGWGLSKSEIGLAKYKGEMNDFSPQDIEQTPIWLVPSGNEIYFLKEKSSEKQKFSL